MNESTIRPLRAVVPAIAALAAAACVAGLLPGFGGPPSPRSFTSLRGQTVELQGYGLYRGDSVSFALQGKAQDLVTLLVGVPLLLLAFRAASRGSLRGGLLLSGTLAYFVYTYASYAFGVQYNAFFLVYVALLSLSAAGLILSLFRLDPEELKRRFAGKAARRAAAAFDFFVAAGVLPLWLARILPGLLGGPDATLIEHYTTLPIQALDLAFVVPLALTAGIELARDRPLGYLLTGLLLMKGLSLGLALGAMMVWAAFAGMPASLAETAVFSSVAAAGLAVAAAYLRAIR